MPYALFFLVSASQTRPLALTAPRCVDKERVRSSAASRETHSLTSLALGALPTLTALILGRVANELGEEGWKRVAVQYGSGTVATSTPVASDKSLSPG